MYFTKKIEKRIVLFEKVLFFWITVPENNNVVLLVRKCKKEDFTNVSYSINLYKNYYFVCQNPKSSISGFVIKKETIKLGYDISKAEKEEYLSGRTIFAKN